MVQFDHLALHSDVLRQIFLFCSTPTLISIARVSKEFHTLAIPVLYRELTIDLSRPNPLCIPPPPPSYASPWHTTLVNPLPHLPPMGAPTEPKRHSSPPDDPGAETEAHTHARSPHLVHTGSITLRPHHWTACHSFGQGQGKAVHLPALRSLRFDINRSTYHWPHGCPFVKALDACTASDDNHSSPSLSPMDGGNNDASSESKAGVRAGTGAGAQRTVRPGLELIISADAGCDVIYWTFASRCYERLPRGLGRLVLVTRPRDMGREWSLANVVRQHRPEGPYALSAPMNTAFASRVSSSELAVGSSCGGDDGLHVGTCHSPTLAEIVIQLEPPAVEPASDIVLNTPAPLRLEEWQAQYLTCELYDCLAALILTRPPKLTLKGFVLPALAPRYPSAENDDDDKNAPASASADALEGEEGEEENRAAVQLLQDELRSAALMLLGKCGQAAARAGTSLVRTSDRVQGDEEHLARLLDEMLMRVNIES